MKFSSLAGISLSSWIRDVGRTNPRSAGDLEDWNTGQVSGNEGMGGRVPGRSSHLIVRRLGF